MTEADPDALEARQEERDFLLRSLDDLEREYAAGNIDDETYRRLHDDYTARAAITLRAMRDGKEPERAAGAPSPSRGQRLLVIGGLVVFAVFAATTLAFALGARLPGGTVTGNSQVRSEVGIAERRRNFEAIAAANPDDPEAQLALARFLMGRQKLVEALESFRVAAGLDPTNAEPFAYSGWIIRLQGYPAESMQLLDKAVTVDPSYPDARFFRGYVLLRDLNQPDRAIPEFQQYLVAAPDSPLAPQVRELLAEAVESGT